MRYNGSTMETKQYNGMNYRQCGGSGLWLSEIGLGLWKWGYPEYDQSRIGEHEGFRVLDRALELGVTHWDTANSYNLGSGNCERLLGRYFRNRPRSAREQVVLATKIRNPVKEEHETSRAFSPNEMGSSRKYIYQAVDGCLERLQTDRIDILYHHMPNVTTEGTWETPLEETWATFEDLLRSGKVLYLAVSNRGGAQLSEENNVLKEVSGRYKDRIIAVQNRYNLIDRDLISADGESEGDFFRRLQREKIGLIPLVPLAVGFLTGRYRRGATDDSGRLATAADKGFAEKYLTEQNYALIDLLDEIASAHDATVAQIALAWLLTKEEIPSVIAGVTRMEQLEDNAGAPKLVLTKQELTRLEHLRV